MNQLSDVASPPFTEFQLRESFRNNSESQLKVKNTLSEYTVSAVAIFLPPSKAISMKFYTNNTDLLYLQKQD